jgi:hypothetical protein
MSQVVGCRPVTVGAWVQFEASLRGICGGQSGTGTCFCQEYWFSLVSIIELMLYTHLLH